jgi:hypothetical protein
MHPDAFKFIYRARKVRAEPQSNFTEESGKQTSQIDRFECCTPLFKRDCNELFTPSRELTDTQHDQASTYGVSRITDVDTDLSTRGADSARSWP